MTCKNTPCSLPPPSPPLLPFDSSYPFFFPRVAKRTQSKLCVQLFAKSVGSILEEEFVFFSFFSSFFGTIISTGCWEKRVSEIFRTKHLIINILGRGRKWMNFWLVLISWEINIFKELFVVSVKFLMILFYSKENLKFVIEIWLKSSWIIWHYL